MSRYDDLINKKLELEEKVEGIKYQLELARTKLEATGELSDPVWFNKANFALSMSKLELKKLNVEIERFKRQMKLEKREKQEERDRSFARTFIRVSKEMLSEKMYLAILNKTTELTDDNKKEFMANKGNGESTMVEAAKGANIYE